MQIHSDFKLNTISFSKRDDLFLFVKERIPNHLDFLRDFLSSKKTIEVTTSGSTGIPKMILLSKDQMLNSAKATSLFFDLPAKTKALNCLSPSYIAGKMMWVRALSLGWHLEVVPVDANPLAHTNATFDFAAMLPMQVQNSINNLAQIDKLIIGGAPVSIPLLTKLQQLSLNIYQTYGMTETITHIAVKQLVAKDKSTQFSTYYKGLPNVQLEVDARGCLVINAPKVASDLVVTNDVVELIQGNEFEWLGRFDHVINSGGVKLFPEIIEQKLKRFISHDFIIGGIPDERLGTQLILIIEKEKPIQNIAEIVSKANLSKFEIPKEVYYVPSFVKTQNGKIKRKETLSLIK